MTSAYLTRLTLSCSVAVRASEVNEFTRAVFAESGLRAYPPRSPRFADDNRAAAPKKPRERLFRNNRRRPLFVSRKALKKSHVERRTPTRRLPVDHLAARFHALNAPY